MDGHRNAIAINIDIDIYEQFFELGLFRPPVAGGRPPPVEVLYAVACMSVPGGMSRGQGKLRSRGTYTYTGTGAYMSI